MTTEYEKKIKFYDKVIQGYKLLLITATFILIVVGVRQVFVVGHKIDINVQNTQQIIQDNQRSTLEARKANIARQSQQTDYIKCIVLITYDHPEYLTTRPTRDQISAALDNCAKVQ